MYAQYVKNSKNLVPQLILSYNFLRIKFVIALQKNKALFTLREEIFVEFNFVDFDFFSLSLVL